MIPMAVGNKNGSDPQLLLLHEIDDTAIESPAVHQKAVQRLLAANDIGVAFVRIQHEMLKDHYPVSILFLSPVVVCRSFCAFKFRVAQIGGSKDRTLDICIPEIRVAEFAVSRT